MKVSAVFFTCANFSKLKTFFYYCDFLIYFGDHNNNNKLIHVPNCATQ